MNVAALIISALGVMWGLAASLLVGPTYVKMLSDMGSPSSPLTQLLLKPWAPLAFSVVCFALVASSTRLDAKWLPLAMSLVTTLAQPTFFLVAMYLPIFELAQAIK